MCLDELKKSFNSLSPSTAVLVGFIGAVLVLGTIGFFILLGFLIKGDVSFSSNKIDNSAAADNNNPVVNQPESLTEPAGTVTPVGNRDHVRGQAGAPLTMIEYSDYECPFCKKFHITMKQLMDAYPGKIKWVYRHFPLSFHANAQKESEAAECAYELGGHEKFWQFSDKIYERTTSNGTGFAVADLPKLAGELGLNKTEFSKCLDNGKYTDYVKTALNEGGAAGVEGTPGTILIDAKGNKQLIKGAYSLEVMKQIIDGVL